MIAIRFSRPFSKITTRAIRAYGEVSVIYSFMVVRGTFRRDALYIGKSAIFAFAMDGGSFGLSGEAVDAVTLGRATQEASAMVHPITSSRDSLAMLRLPE